MDPVDPGFAEPGRVPGPDLAPIAPVEPTAADPTAAAVTAAADPAPRRTLFLPISIAIVAILAGSALFMSGYTMGRQAATEPGTAVSDDAAFQPFWDTYHAIKDRSRRRRRPQRLSRAPSGG
jgi:hypothetical protein